MAAATAFGANGLCIREPNLPWPARKGFKDLGNVKISSRREKLLLQASKKEPFDYGEDPNMEYGDLFIGGKQDPEEPIPPLDPNSEQGFRIFPAEHMIEFVPLSQKVRNDVRRCCCMVSGGVYENLLFFPVIQLLKYRYPGVRLDIVTGERGKQTYEINKNVRRAWVFDPEDRFVVPSDYVETLSKLKNVYYDMFISTKYAGLGHSIFMWLINSPNRISYLYPNVNAAGSNTFLTKGIPAPREVLSEGGYNMYADLVEELGKPALGVPRIEAPPLQVAISKRVKAVVEAKYIDAGVKKGEYIVFHGVESDSAASMKSLGDTDCLLPLSMWDVMAKSCRMDVVFVIPHEKERKKVFEVIGPEAHVVFITTPGQLAGIINDSAGVVTTNTAALQLALSMKKPTVALFASAAKARLFIPPKAENCKVVASESGKLEGVDLEAASAAVNSIGLELLLPLR